MEFMEHCDQKYHAFSLSFLCNDDISDNDDSATENTPKRRKTHTLHSGTQSTKIFANTATMKSYVVKLTRKAGVSSQFLVPGYVLLKHNQELVTGYVFP